MSELLGWLSLAFAVLCLIITVWALIGNRKLQRRYDSLQESQDKGFAELRAGHPEKAVQTFTGYYQEHNLDLPSTGLVVDHIAGDPNQAVKKT